MKAARAIALGCALFVARTAAAEAPAARAHFTAGRAHAHEGRWAEAAREFEASIEIEPSVGACLNLGNAYDKLGKIASASDAFSRAEALATSASGDLNSARASEARARRDALERRVPTITVQTDADAELSIDDQPARVGSPVRINPGSHKVAVARASRVRTLDVAVAESEHATIVVGTPAVTHPTTSNAGSVTRTLGFVGLGAGAAAFVTAGVAYGLAIGSKSDLESTCAAYPQCRPSELDAARTLDDAARTETTIATVALTAGAVLVVAGAVALLLASPATTDRSAGRSALLRW